LAASHSHSDIREQHIRYIWHQLQQQVEDTREDTVKLTVNNCGGWLDETLGDFNF